MSKHRKRSMQNKRVPVFELSKSVRYENRIVAFCDILGWRSKIERAGNRPKDVARIYDVVRLFSQLKAEYEAKNEHRGMRLTTFSDNVVISVPASKNNTILMLIIVARAQLFAARQGHFIRGAITVGKLVHDDHVVFGPALNRAYELESTVAKYPRIILDRGVLPSANALKQSSEFICRENGRTFLNPWSLGFARFLIGTYMRKDLTPRGVLTLIFYEMVNEWEVVRSKKAQLQLQWVGKRILTGLQTEDGTSLLESDHSLRRFLTRR
jgi:hypothetical protein